MHCATPANSSDKNYSHRIHFLAAEIKDNKHAFVSHTTVRASSIPDVRLFHSASGRSLEFHSWSCIIDTFDL